MFFRTQIYRKTFSLEHEIFFVSDSVTFTAVPFTRLRLCLRRIFTLLHTKRVSKERVERPKTII